MQSANPVILQNAVIDHVSDSWPDWQIVFELARKLGYSEEFPWRTAEDEVRGPVTGTPSYRSVMCRVEKK